MRITGPGESPLLLIKVISLADKFAIRHAVVGAMAVSFYGIVRSSLDADAIISLGAGGALDPFLSALREAGFTTEDRKGHSDDPVRGIVSVKDKFANRVDLLTGIKGMPDDVFDRVVKTSFYEHSINMIGVEDLIAMKIFAGSPKDMDDVSGILSVSSKRIDLALLKRLTKRYGSKELKVLEKILDH